MISPGRQSSPGWIGPSAAEAADWPQFRGPGRDGISAEVDLLDSWPEAGPEEVWRVPIGVGYSGMAVVGDRLYTMDSDETTEFAVCLDTATGSELWRTAVGPLYESYFGNGPRTTPTVDGDRLYVLGGRGRLAALEVDSGELIWAVDFVEELGATVPEYGFSGSALVLEDRLIVQPGGSDGRGLAALDKLTGKLLWAIGDDDAGYSSPLLIEVSGVRQLVFMTPRHVLGVTPDGTVLWRHTFAPDTDIKPASPVFMTPDLLFFSASYDVGALTLRLTVDGDTVTATEVWRERVMRNHFNSAVAVDGYLYGFDNATLKCIRAATGEESWAKRGGLGKGSLIFADGRLIVLTESGKLLLLEATADAYRETAAARVLSGRCWTSPTLADGRLYLRNREELVCLDLRSAP